MPRPQRCRRICGKPAFDTFSPEGAESAQQILLTLDEFEVIRLVDLAGQTHAQAARQMDISRSTVTEIYESARRKIADSLVNGHRLTIAGGNYRICDGTASCCTAPLCQHRQADPSTTIYKGEPTMRIAVTYENGQVFQHFGHTSQFKLYDVDNGKIFATQVLDAGGSGHGALAGFLASHHVDVLVCGGIGAGAKTALANAGIRLFGGVQGNADEAAAALVAGSLAYDPEANCDHHDNGEAHTCGDHGCGEHGCH